MECVHHILPCIGNLEVEPLGVDCAAAVIYLKRHVVGVRAYLDCTFEVSTLKTALKHQGLIIRSLQIVIRL